MAFSICLGRLAAWGSVVIWFVNLEIARDASQSTAKLPTTSKQPLFRPTGSQSIDNPGAKNSVYVLRGGFPTGHFEP